jgi:hypothetical protein
MRLYGPGPSMLDGSLPAAGCEEDPINCESITIMKRRSTIAALALPRHWLAARVFPILNSEFRSSALSNAFHKA